MSKLGPPADDWRRQGQEDYLSGERLCLDRYQPYSDSWDHDHCEFCWQKFSLEPGDAQSGYRTEDHYRWICGACFEDFRGEFEWIVVEPERQSGD
jgi:hypothetical protein